MSPALLTLGAEATTTAAAGYVAWFASGVRQNRFPWGAWAFMLVPPAVFGFLFVAGLFGLSSAHIVRWQRLLSGLGSLVAAWGLAVGLILLPVILFGSMVAYAFG